jgi:hypothetical protein
MPAGASGPQSCAVWLEQIESGPLIVHVGGSAVHGPKLTEPVGL